MTETEAIEKKRAIEALYESKAWAQIIEPYLTRKSEILQAIALEKGPEDYNKSAARERLDELLEVRRHLDTIFRNATDVLENAPAEEDGA